MVNTITYSITTTSGDTVDINELTIFGHKVEIVDSCVVLHQPFYLDLTHPDEHIACLCIDQSMPDHRDYWYYYNPVLFINVNHPTWLQILRSNQFDRILCTRDAFDVIIVQCQELGITGLDDSIPDSDELEAFISSFAISE
jgi:hypothetical protein